MYHFQLNALNDIQIIDREQYWEVIKLKAE